MAVGVAVWQAEDLVGAGGFQRGDIVTAINGAAVTQPSDVLALAGMQARVWVVDLIRQGQPLRLRFRF